MFFVPKHFLRNIQKGYQLKQTFYNLKMKQSKLKQYSKKSKLISADIRILRLSLIIEKINTENSDNYCKRQVKSIHFSESFLLLSSFVSKI